MLDSKRGAGGFASAYSTGGGGVVLEHAYGGALLAELLLKGPVVGLGNDVTPVRVGFQQSAFSPVDDLTVAGEGPGGRRSLFVGVRRKPSIGASQVSFIKLMVDYLSVVGERRAELEEGSWRLGLAVAGPHTPADEVGTLAYFARRQPEAALFRAAVDAPRATTAKVRARLGNFDDVVAAAVKMAEADGLAPACGDVGDDLSWLLLKYMHVLDLRLEGDDAAGRTDLVGRLVPLAGDAAAADDLRRRLCELSAGYAVGSAVVDEEMLRRDLSGTVRVSASPAYRASWDVLESLEESLMSRTRRFLAAGRPGATTAAGQLAVDRAEIRAGLVEAMSAAGQVAGPLVVHGEPGAGKSAAVLDAVEEIRRAGGAVVAMSLRDLPLGPPLTTAELLKAPLRTVFAATVGAPVRLVVLDGAEVAQETDPGLLRELARAASQAGLGVVAVTRDDARETVTDTLSAAISAQSGDVPVAPAEFEVTPLGDEEVSLVRQTFAEIGRLADDERSAWLLRRVGVVDILLRGGAVSSLPDGSLSEADVLGAVWYAWVRNRELPSPGGATADGRAETLTGLARRQLAGYATPGVPMTADPRALASLRSDGLLLPAGSRFAFRQGDEFSSDMVRDFALAVVFTRDGFDILRQVGAPRWALRAARMSCQGILINPGPGSPALPARMRELQQEFDALAAESGGRWADLPWEAALTAGSAESILRDCAQDLLQPGETVLDRILRLVGQRFSEAGAADPAIAAPVVAFLVEHPAETAAVRYRIVEEVGKLIASWLRAVRRAEMADTTIDRWRPLRARVREYLLRVGGADSEIEAECLALLGADADAAVARRLRGIASGRANGLVGCIERFDPTMSLAAADLDLLFELTEAYYIEQPPVSALNWFDMGIRRHKYTHGGFGVPFADWRFGPFWRLLPTAPVRSLALINRMLDHAVDCRLDASAAPPVQLDIPGVGRNYFAGDEEVWGWYRGMGRGPYPCMSALMAVERIADQWLQLGVPLPSLITMMLRDAHNLAMPGLIVGLLARHAEQIAAEADPFLTNADVWKLESIRVGLEAGIHAQGRDDPSLHGSDRRSWTMVNLAGCLVVNAINRGDQDRIDALRAAGSVLTTAARETSGRAGGGDDGPLADGAESTTGNAGENRHSLVVRSWASMLDASNYTARDDNGNLLWEWQPPADVKAVLTAEDSDRERRRQMHRLLKTYSLRPAEPYLAGPPPLPPAQALAADIQVARSLADQSSVPGPQPHDAATAVAAAMLRAAVEQARLAKGDDLEWAALTIATAMIHPPVVPEASGDTVFLTGAGRSAASAGACLLMPAFTEPGAEPALLDDEDLAKLGEIIAEVAASPFTGLRMLLARSLEPVWTAPCGPGPGSSDRCRHAIAWTAVKAASRAVALGPLELPAGRRERRQLDGPLLPALRECPAGDLMLDLLAPPLVSACDAARSGNCIALAARDLRDSLLEAYTRTAVLWGKEGYDHRDEDQYAVAEALLGAEAQEPGMLIAFVAGLAGQARALSETLRALTVTATYSASARASLRRAWPAVMTAVLDAVDAGAQGLTDRNWGDYAIAELIPSPSPVSGDTEPAATISAARDGWPTPPELISQIERLLPYAAGYWHAADNLIGLLKTMPLADQANVGLPLVRKILTNRRMPGMGTWWAVGWLRSLSEANVVGNTVRPIYDALIDRLAVEDYQGAVQLQRQGE